MGVLQQNHNLYNFVSAVRYLSLTLPFRAALRIVTIVDCTDCYV